MMISKLCGVYMDLIIQSGESLSIYNITDQRQNSN